jgi:multiple sugar transport system substrate-binding protein
MWWRWLLVLCLLWTGCQPAPHVTLATWGSSAEIALTRQVVADFQRQHPAIRVQVLHIPDQYFQKLHILFAGGVAPDVVQMNSFYLPVYAQAQCLAPLPAPTNTFYPQALKALQWQGTQFALPRDVSSLVVYYNQDLFQQAGLPTPSPDWDWATFERTAQALSGNGRYGVSFNRKPPLFWLPFIWSAGGRLWEGQQLFPDTPQTLAGLGFYQRWPGRIAPPVTESRPMAELFIKQQVAMFVSGRWSVPVLREKAPFAWGVVPLPRGSAGSVVGIDATGYALSATAKHPEQARQLIAYLTDHAAIAHFTQTGLIVPARPDVANSPAFAPPNQVFLNTLAHGVPTQSVPRWNEVAETLDLTLEPLWTGEKTPEQVLPALRQAVAPLL